MQLINVITRIKVEKKQFDQNKKKLLENKLKTSDVMR